MCQRILLLLPLRVRSHFATVLGQHSRTDFIFAILVSNIKAGRPVIAVLIVPAGLHLVP